MIGSARWGSLILFCSACTTVPSSGFEPEPITAGDIAALAEAARQCGLPEGALTLVQLDNPPITVIRTNRSYVDTEAKFSCAMNALPADFHTRFGLEVDDPS